MAKGGRQRRHPFVKVRCEGERRDRSVSREKSYRLIVSAGGRLCKGDVSARCESREVDELVRDPDTLMTMGHQDGSAAESAATKRRPEGAEVGRRGEGRQRIIDAATELFSTRGYAATTTRDIALHAGIRQPSIYSHFPVKADILTAVVQQTVYSTVDMFDEMTSAEPESVGVERLLRLVEYDVRLLCSGEWNVALLGYIPDARADDIEVRMRPHNLQLRARYREAVAGALEESSRDDDPDLIADVVMALVEGVILHRVRHPGSGSGAKELALAVREAARRIVA